MITTAISLLHNRQSLDFEQMRDVIEEIMSGECQQEQIVDLLTALYEKGESVDELAGAALALRRRMTTLPCDRPYLVDTCGTGGSGKNTFNISTAAALVSAAAGATVAKHGNRAITGRSGSADVLQALGVNIEASLEVTRRCLNELGICFCFAPMFHPSVRHASAARKQLHFPTIFNLLGPLCNPAAAPYQVLGAGRGETRQLLANALAKLGTTRTVVVHGADGIGEVTLGGTTLVSLVSDEGVEELEWQPEDFGVEPCPLAALQVNDPRDSAAMIIGVLDNRPGPPRESVVANVAACLWLVGLAEDLADGASQARAVLASGKPRELLDHLIRLSNETEI